MLNTLKIKCHILNIVVKSVNKWIIHEGKMYFFYIYIICHYVACQVQIMYILYIYNSTNLIKLLP